MKPDGQSLDGADEDGHHWRPEMPRRYTKPLDPCLGNVKQLEELVVWDGNQQPASCTTTDVASRVDDRCGMYCIRTVYIIMQQCIDWRLQVEHMDCAANPGFVSADMFCSTRRIG